MSTAIRTPREVRLPEKTADQATREHKAAVVALISQPLLRNNTVTVTFAAPTTPTRVTHGLVGRPKGYIVVRSDSALTVYDAIPASADRPEDIWLQSSDTGTVTLFIF